MAFHVALHTSARAVALAAALPRSSVLALRPLIQVPLLLQTGGFYHSSSRYSNDDSRETHRYSPNDRAPYERRNNRMVVCYKCGEGGHVSKDCTKKEPVCYNCNQPGHLSKDCQNPQAERVCYLCNQPGHLARDCESSPASSQSQGQECYKCGQRGHISRNCPSAGVESSHSAFGSNKPFRSQHGGPRDGSFGNSDNKKCFTCGNFGHLSRECPNPPKCYRCGGVGHISKDCSQPQKAPTCHNCKQEGHIARECPNNAL